MFGGVFNSSYVFCSRNWLRVIQYASQANIHIHIHIHHRERVSINVCCGKASELKFKAYGKMIAACRF